jgi:iron complex outermembrane receptor protein
VLERDEHLTWFGEAAYTRHAGAGTWVFGGALQQERYQAEDVTGFDYTFTTPGLFAQATFDPTPRVAVTASSRVDWHSEYGTIASPRVSVLVRTGDSWSVRASAGGGYFAPTPFTEETEVTGLTPVRALPALRAERAVGVTLDVGGAIGAVEVNGTLFGSVVEHPLAVRDAATALPRIELLNAAGPTRTTGAELLLRWSLEPLRVTASYTHVRSREADPATGARRWAALTPRHQAGIVAALEHEGRSRFGLEVYYTGAQPLHDDSYRVESRPYVHVGVLAERRVGRARLFVNAENLLDVRQTKHDPLVRPFPGLGGRWTNDVWAPLDGRVANVGVRFDAR